MESPEARDDGRLQGLDAEDPLAVASAVRKCAELLRTAPWEPAALVALVQKLATLASDPSPRVRQSVAEVTPYLPEAALQEILPALAEDRSPFVRGAVDWARRKRSTLRREAVEDEEHDTRVDRWYRELGAKGMRATARRIASHETEYFVRRMVHEAGAAFMGFADAAKKLRAGLDAPELDRAALRAELDRAEERFALLRHVLETGRTHAQAATPVYRSESVADLVADEAELAVARFRERAGAVEIDLSGLDRPLVAEVDAGFLRQALANIFKNAVEAYDASPGALARVRVGARVLPGGTDLAIAIADAGCGMGDRDVARAFVPFGSSKPGGTGFGLFVARRVARSVHGGDLSLTSELGVGTTVTMTLPLRQEAPKKRRPKRGDAA
jgi:signal transduction histidine kinase